MPHFITQRGHARQAVFLTNALRRAYLALLSEHAARNGLRLLAYCVMTNHVHLVAVPATVFSMANAFRNIHGRFSQVRNVLEHRTGQVWQNRFYSCPVKEDAIEELMAYVENGPVRAGLVACAEDFEWSSARAHLGDITAGPALDLAWWHQRWTPEYWRRILLNSADCSVTTTPSTDLPQIASARGVERDYAATST